MVRMVCGHIPDPSRPSDFAKIHATHLSRGQEGRATIGSTSEDSFMLVLARAEFYPIL